MGNTNYKTNPNHYISSNVNGALAALLFANHSVQL